LSINYHVDNLSGKVEIGKIHETQEWLSNKKKDSAMIM